MKVLNGAEQELGHFETEKNPFDSWVELFCAVAKGWRLLCDCKFSFSSIQLCLVLPNSTSVGNRNSGSIQPCKGVVGTGAEVGFCGGGVGTPLRPYASFLVCRTPGPKICLVYALILLIILLGTV